jgi:hypothetical protein
MKDPIVMRAFKKGPSVWWHPGETFGVVALGETSSAGWATSAVKGAFTA